MHAAVDVSDSPNYPLSFQTKFSHRQRRSDSLLALGLPLADNTLDTLEHYSVLLMPSACHVLHAARITTNDAGTVPTALQAVAAMNTQHRTPLSPSHDLTHNPMRPPAHPQRSQPALHSRSHCTQPTTTVLRTRAGVLRPQAHPTPLPKHSMLGVPPSRAAVPQPCAMDSSRHARAHAGAVSERAQALTAPVTGLSHTAATVPRPHSGLPRLPPRGRGTLLLKGTPERDDMSFVPLYVHLRTVSRPTKLALVTLMLAALFPARLATAANRNSPIHSRCSIPGATRMLPSTQSPLSNIPPAPSRRHGPAWYEPPSRRPRPPRLKYE